MQDSRIERAITACIAATALMLLVLLVSIGFLLAPNAEAGASVSGADSGKRSSEVRDYIVLYKKKVDLDRQLESEESKGNEVEDRFESTINGALLELEADDVSRLRKDDRVLAIEPDGPVSIALQSQGSRSAASWGLDRVDQRDLPLDGTISTALDGQGVEAYILDTGIRLDHSEFTGRINPEGFTDFPGGWDDCDGHGTHVAGTVAGSTYGVAPAATLTAVRVLDCNGSGSYAGIIAGIDWVISDHGAGEPAVANMSLGGPLSTTLNVAVQRAIDDGVSMVVAAGNDNGADACTRSPASAPNAVTVGSTTSSDSVSSFSNQGSCVDLFAPGSSIKSAWHTSSTATNTISGTSMAAPHVAGIAALLLSGQPAMSPAAIDSRLVASASPGRLSGVTGCTKNLLAYAGSGADLPTPPPSNRPSNDDFANRRTLTTLSGVNGTTACATRESGEPSHGTGSSASIWYSWTAPSNGTLTLRTQGSSYDTLLAAYSGSSVQSLSQRAQNDDSGDGGLWSRISFAVTSGTVYAIAIDGYGGSQGATALSGSFEVDSSLAPPNITSGPSGLTSSTSASFSFTGEPGASFKCRLDNGSWESCNSPKTYPGLSEGPHTFRVTQTGQTGNTSAEATRDWTIDSIAPDAPNITSGPSGPTGSTSASFSFTGEPGASFECRLDDGDWKTCSSPQAYTDLSEGPRTFRVTQFDLAGNISQEATRTWTVDTIAPAAPAITSGPSGPTGSTRASFSFTGEPGASFECRLDNGSWESCNSPKTYPGLSEGPHTFQVTQTDQAQNTSAEATRAWSVDTIAPDPPNITSGPLALTKLATATLAFTGEVDATFECRLDSADWGSCTSPMTYPGLSEGPHTFRARQSDQAGNSSAEATHTWTTDTIAPAAPKIASGPVSQTTSTSASFFFTGESGVIFECRLDDGSWGTCTSPKTYTGLSEAPHTFRVRQSDQAGNSSAEATHTWTIRPVPPPTIKAGPARKARSNTARFTFSGEAGSTFQCRLNSSPWASCSSPATYRKLKPGGHTFQVRQVDGERSSQPARYRWRILKKR